MIIGLIAKSKEGEKKNTYAQLIETSKTEVADLAFDKTINGNNNFDFNDIYSKPFFTNNYDIVNGNIVKKNTNTPIISKSDYENLLKPHFNTTIHLHQVLLVRHLLLLVCQALLPLLQCLLLQNHKCM